MGDALQGRLGQWVAALKKPLTGLSAARGSADLPVRRIQTGGQGLGAIAEAKTEETLGHAGP